MEIQQSTNITEGCRVDKVGRKIWTDDQREAILSRYQDSLLSRIEFARQEGMSPSTLGWWLNRKVVKGPGKVKFQAVKTKPLFRGREVLAELDLGNGKRIALWAECGEEFMKRMISVLK